MYQTLIVIQYISIIILMLNIVYILDMKQGHIQRDLLFLHIGMLITIMAYTAEMQAATEDIMRLCVKFSYVGKPIIILSVFLMAVDYCKVEISSFIRKLLASVQMIVILIVYTFDKHHLFYTYTKYTSEGMFPHLSKGHGIIYNIYTALIIVYAVASIAIYIVYALRTQNVHEKRICILLSCITTVPFIGFAFYLSGMSGGYDCTITGYAFATIFFAIIFRNFDVFETVNLATDKVIRYLNAGLIVYDEHGSLIHINNKAKRMKIVDQVEKLYKSREYFCFEDNYYRVEKFKIEHDGEYFGYAYYLDNETNNYKYEERLREEIQRADEANKAKKRYLSSMSHDIRTPMNSILGLSHLAELHIDDKDRVLDCLDKIDTAGNQLLELINEVLDVNKTDTDMVEMKEEVFDVKNLIEDISNVSRTVMDAKNHTFSVDTDRIKNSVVTGDKSRLSQILLNLISNAAKYTNEGGHIEVLVDETERGDGSSLYSFAIKDNGIGISKERIAAAFEPLSNVRDGNETRRFVTGLNITATKYFTELMGGTIKIDSKVDTGTTCTVSIPFKISDASSIEVISDLKVDSSISDFIGKKVLLVEDDEMNAEVTGEILSMTGMFVEYAVDGKDAVEKFAEAPENHYDAILMDLHLPRMNGYEAATAIRKLGKRYAKDVPILAMTAGNSSENMLNIKEAGMNDCIVKPLDYSKLYRSLNHYFVKDK